MTFQCDAIEGGLCVKPSGVFGGPQIRTMRLEVESNFEGNQAYLVLDLRDVDFIDSMGLGALLVFSTALRNRGGDLVLAAPPPKVTEVLGLTRLDKVLTIVEEVPVLLPVPSGEKS